MGAPLTDESKRLLKLLEDGEWHSLPTIKAALAVTIAPGKALRKYQEKADQYHNKVAPRVGPELSDEQKIASGQKQIAYITIRSMKRNFCEIRDVPGGPPEIRLRPEILAEHRQQMAPQPSIEQTPGEQDPKPCEPALPSEPSDSDGSPRPSSSEGPTACEVCGLYVANLVQHEDFHKAWPGPPVACAFFSEDQVRLLVQQEVEHALDAFQRGMQSWLINRFAALELLLQGVPRSSRDRNLDRVRRMERGFER